jgi:hypothetical protein
LNRIHWAAVPKQLASSFRALGGGEFLM